MRSRAVVAALITFVVYGCATTAPKRSPAEQLHGTASWYGEEFAGRTTANGEIFDPMQLTAAHRTLPFGTVLDVTNPKTNQTVRVRINDRGPYIGNRIIDLSYAAAQQVGLIEPGSGEVDLKIVTLGLGDREPPAPYVVQASEPKQKAVIAAGDPPNVAFPLPSQTSTTTVTSPDDDFRVEVVDSKTGVPTRRQVAPDGKTIENVPIEGAVPVVSAPGHPAAEKVDRAPAKEVQPKRASAAPRFLVQVGAFAVEANANALNQRLIAIGQQSHIDREQLYLVRIGPFATRAEALKVRGDLEAKGLSAIIVTE